MSLLSGVRFVSKNDRQSQPAERVAKENATEKPEKAEKATKRKKEHKKDKKRKHRHHSSSESSDEGAVVRRKSDKSNAIVPQQHSGLWHQEASDSESDLDMAAAAEQMRRDELRAHYEHDMPQERPVAMAEAPKSNQSAADALRARLRAPSAPASAGVARSNLDLNVRRQLLIAKSQGKGQGK